MPSPICGRQLKRKGLAHRLTGSLVKIERKHFFFLETSLAGLEGLVDDGNVHQPMRICVIRMNFEGKENQESCHILCPRKVRVDKV